MLFGNKLKTKLRMWTAQNMSKNKTETCSPEVKNHVFIKLQNAVMRHGFQNKPPNSLIATKR